MRRRCARRGPAGTILVAATVGLALSACSSTPAGSPHNPSSTRPSALTTSTTAPPATTTTTTTTAVTTTTTDPGLLPQTETEPPVAGSALRATLQPLWDAIVSGSQSEALPVFFPETAYVKMKTGLLPSPVSDYTDRLIAFYNLDLAAYHEALGPDPSSVQLLQVDGSPADAAWIEAGDCENLIGYWHLPGVRFVYRQGGAVKSFAVASLISWRGVWYVVHLGPNPRPENVGTVDQPAAGAGTPGPPGGC
jgi:hypothetical protein